MEDKKHTCRTNSLFIHFPIKNTFIQKLFYKTISNEKISLCHKMNKNRASYFPCLSNKDSLAKDRASLQVKLGKK